MRHGRPTRHIKGTGGVTYESAVALQEEIRKRLVDTRQQGSVSVVAGADIAFAAHGRTAVAAIVALSWPELEVIDYAVSARRVDFPYIPGLLSFREVPTLQDAFERLHAKPDVVFCDGQGRAHPRRFGLACHLGVVLGTPTIGCAKSVLVGEFDEPGRLRGSTSCMRESGEIVGSAVRTRDGVKPMYVSAGHMMDLAGAVKMVLAAGRGYRVPEPTRRAHILAGEAKSAIEQSGTTKHIAPPTTLLSP